MNASRIVLYTSLAIMLFLGAVPCRAEGPAAESVDSEKPTSDSPPDSPEKEFDPAAIFAEAGESFEAEEDSGGTVSEERFAIYGYGVDILNAALITEDKRVVDSDFGNTLYVRLKGDWNPEESLAFHMELAYTAGVGNLNQYSTLERYGFSDVDQLSFPIHDFNQAFSVDHLYGSVNFRRFDLQFGKIPLGWGTGYVFNPTARAHSTAFLDDTSEETPGTLAVTLSLSIIDQLAIQGYAAFQDRNHKQTAFIEDGFWKNMPFGAKIQAITGPFDFSFSWIKEVVYTDADYRPLREILEEQGLEFVQELQFNALALSLLEAGYTDQVIDLYADAAMEAFSADHVERDGYRRNYYLGTDFAGAVWDFGVYGEAAILFPWDEDENRFDFRGHRFKDLVQASIGFDYMIPVLLIQTWVEYHHSGPGATDTEEYDILTAFNEGQGLQGEDYLFAYVDRIFGDYFTVAVGSLISLTDGSLVLFPVLTYEAFSNFQVSLGSYLFFGKEGTEFYGEYDIYGIKTIDITEPSVYLRCKLSF